MSEFERQLNKAVTRMSGRSIPTTDYSLSQDVRISPAQFPDAIRVPPFSPPSTGMSRDWTGGSMQLAVGDFHYRHHRQFVHPWDRKANQPGSQGQKPKPPVTSEDEDLNVAPAPSQPLPTSMTPQPAPAQPAPAQPSQKTRKDGSVIPPFPESTRELFSRPEAPKRTRKAPYVPPTRPGEVGAVKVKPREAADKEPQYSPPAKFERETPPKREPAVKKTLTKSLTKTMPSKAKTAPGVEEGRTPHKKNQPKKGRYV